MEEEKGNREKAKVIDTSHPHSLLRKSPRKHVSISSSATSASLCSPLPLNPQDSPDFFICHCCGIHDGGVQTLESQWRVVLLCHRCLARIRSAAICSYCFNARDVDVLICRSCLCLVHLTCVPVQRGYITLSELDPVSFTCIDCCAIPRPRFRDPGLPRVLLENLIRNVSSAAKKKVALAARARLKALKKADEARVAMELAFDAILFARDAAVEDEKLAMQLHRVINGSPRILRRKGQASLGHYLRVKKDCGNGGANSMRWKSNKRRGRIHENVGICCKKDDAVFESNSTSLSERNSCIKPGIAGKKEQLEIDAPYASGSTEVTLAKKKGRHFDVVVNYDGEVSNDGLTLISCRESADSNSFMEASECGRGAGEVSPKLQEEEECTVPDRCVLKCCKITSRLKQY